MAGSTSDVAAGVAIAASNPPRRRARELVLFGVPVEIDLSWLLGLGLATWTFADGVFPSAAPGHGTRAYWAAGALTALGLGLSIAAHEAAHCLAARRLGLPVLRVVLSLFGGATESAIAPRTPAAVVRVAAAGPLASLALFGLAAIVHVVLVEAGADVLLAALVALVAAGNLFVLLLNLAPALPLDGGQLLAAAIWRLTGRPASALRIAAAAGRVLGTGLIVLAVLASASGDAAIAVWAAFLGLVIRQQARAADGSGATVRSAAGLDRAAVGGTSERPAA